MTFIDITLIGAYLVGIIINGIIYRSQKQEIKKLQNVNGEIERYFKIFNVDSVEKLIGLKEKYFEQEKKMMINEISTKYTADFMEKVGHKSLQKHFKKFEGKMGEQFNELGWFVVEFLYTLPEEEREELIKTEFPKSETLIRDNLKVIEDAENDTLDKEDQEEKR